MINHCAKAFMVSAVFLVSGACHASTYPSQPVKLLVGYAPGGSVDIVARDFSQRLSQELGQSVVVENRPGATGMIALQATANAVPDGYTLNFVASAGITLTPAIIETRIDPMTDFTPVSTVVDYTNILLVREDSPYKTVKDLVADAAKRPGELTYGSTGNGSSNHISGEILADKGDVKLSHVPYKGNAPAMMDMLAGRITMVFDLNTSAMGHVSSGKVRALAVTSSKRNPLFPEVPTMVEAGFEGYEFSGWVGLIGPAGMASEVVEKLAHATDNILNDAQFQERMLASGYTIMRSTPDEMRSIIKTEGEKFADLAVRYNLKQKMQ